MFGPFCGVERWLAMARWARGGGGAGGQERERRKVEKRGREVDVSHYSNTKCTGTCPD